MPSAAVLCSFQPLCVQGKPVWKLLITSGLPSTPAYTGKTMHHRPPKAACTFNPCVYRGNKQSADESRRLFLQPLSTQGKPRSCDRGLGPCPSIPAYTGKTPRDGNDTIASDFNPCVYRENTDEASAVAVVPLQPLRTQGKQKRCLFQTQSEPSTPAHTGKTGV